MLFGRQSGVARKGWFRTDFRPPALAIVREAVDRVVDRHRDRLHRDLHQRHARHAPRRGRTRRQTLENLASGIDADISRNIELYDLSLRAVTSNLVMPEIKGVGKEIQHLIRFDHAATARHFGVIQVFDAQGRLTHDAATLDPPPENCADEEDFKVHRTDPDLGLYISRPMVRRGAVSDRAQPAHHRCRWRLPRRRGGLDPFQRFPRPVRPAQPQSRRHDHGAAQRSHDHYADAVSTSTSSERIRRRSQAGARIISRQARPMPALVRSIRRRGFTSGAAARACSSWWSESRWRVS